MPKLHAGRAAIRMILTLAVLAPLIATVLGPLSSRGLELPLACGDLAFSTEEDFVLQEPPSDGNPIVSDGDLLGLDNSAGVPAVSCVICARNHDLLGPFGVAVDLGLDAVDVVDVAGALVAFSTELDSPPQAQVFTAGDMLVTNGAIVPNLALTYLFDVNYDLGLDALHLVGDPDALIAVLDEVAQVSREEWLRAPDTLSELLISYEADIWFSVEGTHQPLEGQRLLDGDLLSAAKGVVVSGNDQLLPGTVPAGIPVRGIDYGLDAVSGDRTSEPQGLHFSTEILHRGSPTFSDGDILRLGNGVVASNEDLMQCFGPMAGFLGLDALHITSEAVLRTYLPLALKQYGIPR